MYQVESWAMVTGASSGIGKEIAKILYSKGYNMILVSSNEQKLNAVKNELQSINKNSKVEVIEADLSHPEGANKVFEFTEKNNINIYILVNNAGIGIWEEIGESSPERLLKMLNLNISSLTILCNKYAKQMKKQKSGMILNIASTAAYQPVPYLASYAATKSYVLNFSEAIAMELKSYGVSVTCVSPGNTNTNFFKNAHIEDSHSFYGLHTRSSPKKVAKYAVDAMFKCKVSGIFGIKNNILATLNKISPRFLVAKIAKFIVGKAPGKAR